VNRNTFRVLGIIAGILAGTITALLFRSTFKSSFRPESRSKFEQAEKPAESYADSDEMPTRIKPPDPGRRIELKGMVAEAKKEVGWLKEFELTERSGKSIQSEDLRGEPYIACFFFSTCPGTCTRQSNQMQLLQSKFKGKPIKFVSISVDPEIDTPNVLAEYADKFQADKDRWLFLTGDIGYIIRIGTEKFFLSGVEKRGHPDKFCLVDGQGDLVGSYSWQVQAERDQLTAHANELLDSK
jgi:cytochrome oxidase Cu insertion factor (SCO1/SenC/PrrC family)